MQAPFRAYQGNDPYIFVSYAHADWDAVFSELTHLSDRGFNVWYDEGIHPGSIWRQEIAERILGCTWFIYLVSPNSVSSSNCIKEVNFALDHDKPIVVIYLEDTRLPPGLHLAIGDIQAIHKPRLSPSAYERKVLNVLGNERDHVADMGEALSGFGDETVSIAVLPFANMSNDPDQEFFCDGISEEIINGLTRIVEIKVIARTSSFEYKNRNINVRVIGENLNVNHVLQGSVRKSGNRLRIGVQLVLAKDGSNVWTERYDRDLIDFFDLQDEITTEILEALDVRFNRRARAKEPVNLEAYNAMLLGRYHAGRMEYEPAFAAYQKAIELEPNLADAHAGLAQIYDVQDNVAPDPKVRRLVEDHVDRALALDQMQPLAMCIRLQRRYLKGDIQYALDAFAELLRDRPNEYVVILFYESFLRCLRREEESLRLLERLVEIDPLNSLTYFQKGEALRYYGRYDASRRAYEQAGQLGMPIAGILAVLARESKDKQLLAAQVRKPRSEWGILEHFYDTFVVDGDERMLQFGDDGSWYDRFIVAFTNRDGERATEYLRAALAAGEWLAFSYALGTAASKRDYPEFFESSDYIDMLAEFGLDEASLTNLHVAPLPF